MRINSSLTGLFGPCAAVLALVVFTPALAQAPVVAQTADVTQTAIVAKAPPEPSAAGFWQAYFDDGKPSGWFYFTDHNGVYEGRLVKMFKKPGEDHLVETCSKCPGAMKDAPMLGLTIVTNMKRSGARYEDGNILDPRDGSVYNAQMEVSPDGKSLYVRGYLGISLLGQTQTWTRLPDDVIPAGAIPGDPLAAAAAKKPPAAPPRKPPTKP